MVETFCLSTITTESFSYCLLSNRGSFLPLVRRTNDEKSKRITAVHCARAIFIRSFLVLVSLAAVFWMSHNALLGERCEGDHSCMSCFVAVYFQAEAQFSLLLHVSQVHVCLHFLWAPNVNFRKISVRKKI